MGKNGKLTKHIVYNALRRTDNISEIAELLGVARINIYRAIRRWGLDRPMRKAENVTPEIVDPEPSSAQPEPISETALQGKVVDFMDRGMAFSGRWLGDVGRKHH